MMMNSNESFSQVPDEGLKNTRSEKSFLPGQSSEAKQIFAVSNVDREYLALVAHELKNPLQAVMGWLEILKDTADEEVRLHAYEVIGRNTRTQIRLIKDLVDAADLSNWKISFRMKELDFTALVAGEIESLQPLISSKQIKLEKKLAADNVLLVGDESRLRQLVSNLLENAIKFTPQNGKISVNLEKNDGTAMLKISDSGCGIEPALLPFVFDYLKKENEFTKGLGLGLFLAQKITEHHQGTITVESAGRNRGTTFLIRLPVRAGLI